MGVVAPAEVVDRLEALLEAGERDQLLAVLMGEVAGASPEQVELMRSLPAWEARLAVAHTIPRELRAEREYAFDAMAYAALPDSRVVVMPGQGHVAMDTGTDLVTAEVLRFVEATDT